MAEKVRGEKENLLFGVDLDELSRFEKKHGGDEKESEKGTDHVAKAQKVKGENKGMEGHFLLISSLYRAASVCSYNLISGYSSLLVFTS